MMFGTRRAALFGGGVPRYLLYDDFRDALAAGSVNGTYSTSPLPTGGGVLRTVTDANTKLSIASNAATFATGGSATGNPGLWYEQFTRQAGLMLFGRIVTGGGSASNQAMFGWDATQAGDINDCIGFDASLSMRVQMGGAAKAIGVWAISTTYNLCIILRGTGAHYFIKGGAFTNWTLLWTSGSGTGNQFPSFVAFSTTAVFTAPSIRLPAFLYIPPALVYDTFTRSNGALGNTETADPDSRPLTAKAWTANQGTWAVATNKAAASALDGGSVAIATYDAGAANVIHTAKLTRSAANVGVVVRYVDSSNYVIGYHDGTNAKLDKVVAGVTTNVASAAATYGAGNELRIICDGTSFQLFYNNVKIGSTGTISDAALQSPTLHGLFTTDTGNSIDDVTTRARGSANEYGALDAF